MKSRFVPIFLCLFTASVANDVSNGTCFDDVSWTTANGSLILNDKYVFHLKGLSWWGMQGPNVAPLGVDSRTKKPISFFLDWIQENNFNAMRFPHSVKMVLENPSTKLDPGSNPDTYKLKAVDLLEYIIDEAGKRGILVMLDQHTLGYYSASGLWYDDVYSEDDFIKSWDILLERFESKWNVFAIDLLNEPHHDATWGSGNPKTDWDQEAVKLIKHIATKHPQYKGLFFVEGICCGFRDTAWFAPMKEHRFTTGEPELDKRVVFSPHSYNPSRKNDRPLPPKMWKTWEAMWGWIEPATGHAVVLGEWGATYTNPKGKKWMNQFIRYLKKNCLTDQFYWSLKGDEEKGLLTSDWETPHKQKLKKVNSVQPSPSKLTKKGDKLCFEPGKSNCG